MLNISRVAWTGGATPTKSIKKKIVFKSLRRQYFRELVQNCGGLDLWKCAGTSSLERAKIFWNQATLDAYRSLETHVRNNMRQGSNWTTTETLKVGKATVAPGQKLWIRNSSLGIIADGIVNLSRVNQHNNWNIDLDTFIKWFEPISTK